MCLGFKQVVAKLLCGAVDICCFHSPSHGGEPATEAFGVVYMRQFLLSSL